MLQVYGCTEENIISASRKRINRKKNPIALSLDKIKQPSSNQVDISMVDIQNGNGWQKY